MHEADGPNSKSRKKGGVKKSYSVFDRISQNNPLLYRFANQNN